jgi:hypothetical protein
MFIISIPLSVDTATLVSVTCYTIKGETLWEYKDLSVLNDPWGVTVDTNSNVYVSSYNISTVAVVEPNGRQGRQLISGDDGLCDPTGIYFDKSKNSLLITSYIGMVRQATLLN